MITYFCGLWPSKTKNEELVEAYHRAFRAYTDKQISNAGDQAMQEMEFFPKPVDIIRRIPQEATDSSGTIGYEVRKCQECGAVKHCIEDPIGCGEWQCRPCYTGLSDQEIADRFAKLGKSLRGKFKFPGEKIIEGDYKR